MPAPVSASGANARSAGVGTSTAHLSATTMQGVSGGIREGPVGGGDIRREGEIRRNRERGKSPCPYVSELSRAHSLEKASVIT